MQNTYDFVGGPLHGQRKSSGPADFPMRVTGGTYRLTGAGHSVGVGQPSVYTVLFWPDRNATEQDNELRPVKVGDPFPLDVAGFGAP